MKLKFDANLPYQQEAIQSAVGVFEGQPSNQSQFEVSFTTQMDMLEQTELGIGNRLAIDTGRVLDNTHTVQEANDIPKSRDLGTTIYPSGKSTINPQTSYIFPNFSVEMETGTGKTYVYLRTVFELNQKYGFKKFIIVVPSVAIREGVLKSIEITKEHFAGIYDNVPLDYFVYDSKKLGKVRQFATRPYSDIPGRCKNRTGSSRDSARAHSSSCADGNRRDRPGWI